MAKRTKTGVISPVSGVYDTDELAEILGVHRRTVQRLIVSGEMGAIKVGRRLRVTEDQLKAFIQRQQIPMPQTERTE
jgi:excisionase family DNA binding protein